jgi:hypothetical protein
MKMHLLRDFALTLAIGCGGLFLIVFLTLAGLYRLERKADRWAGV